MIHPSDLLTDHLPNGAGWIVYNYLKGLVERGHTVHVATPRLEMRGPVPAGMHPHLIPRTQASGLLGRIGYIRAARRLFTSLSRSIRFDIAQQFTPVETGLSFSVLGTGTPLVLGPYSGYWPADADGEPRPPTLMTRLKHFGRDSLSFVQQKQAAALVITCPAARERVASAESKRTRVHVIGHGIDSAAYRERDGLPSHPSILFLANLEYRKGIFTLLEAFERVAAAVPEATLEVWGDGAERAAVEERVGRSDFRERIHCRGRAERDKVGEIMRSASVYCMPSHGEPFGMTLLEAMASGVPVVTTDLGGPPHIVHPGGGRIVPVRHAAALASALIEILSSADMQRSMGRYNRMRIEQEFDWSRSLDRMETVYENVLRARGA